ncbi:lipoprotein [Mycoplasma mycoides]|uniref:lipoprotein n=1 Tax=Mycoplasma mycoides TaxID=2102 RepID=UPI002240C06C|nr:lipoprotein [Mycoplasma mycoides]QVK05646.1 lipoprotein [Mycoplasma mycoides subsp. capri]QVK08161.1 lipoprotein [Mycoplasma mycoides subsp. capri]
MKKLLTILGSLTLIASGGALVVACNRTQPNNNDKKPNPVNPSEKDPSKDPKDGNKPGGNKEPKTPEKDPTKKPKDDDKSKDKDEKTPGENTTPKTPEKKPVKKPVRNAALASANDTQLLFDETISEATRSWNRAHIEKISKAEMDKIAAKITYEKTMASFIDNAGRFLDDEYKIQLEKRNLEYDEISRRANEDWDDFDALDAIEASSDITKDLFDETISEAKVDWAKKYEKIKFFKQLGEKFRNTASSTAEEYFKVLDTTKEQKIWAKNKAEKERIYKEFATNSSNTTEEYFKILDTTKERKDWKTRKDLEEHIRRQKDNEDSAVSRQPRVKPTAEGSDRTNSWLDGLNRNPKNQ